MQLIHGDCLEEMPKLISDGVRVDVVITDPPYGVNLDYASYDDTLENWKELMLASLPLMRELADMVIMPSCQINQLGWKYDEDNSQFYYLLDKASISA